MDTNTPQLPQEQRQTKEKRQNDKKARLRIPTAIKVIYIIGACFVPIYVAFLLSEPFSDFFNRYISSVFRAILAHITSILPFSLAEFFLLGIPVWVILLTRILVRRYGESWREIASAAVCIFSAFAIMFSSFTLMFASAYRGSTLDKKLGMERERVSAEELYGTAQILTEKLRAEVDEVCFGEDGFSVMPYNINEMNDILIDDYAVVCEKYDFVQRLDSRVKPVMLSELMSYTHITGVYTFFTGEANININFPDYTVPFTAAHELSHQRGIAREDEANFMAFLVCSGSSDAYVRYSAYLNMLEYVMAALSSSDFGLYSRMYYELPEQVKGELAAYSEFYAKYRDSAAADVSQAVNDAFLVMHGTPGVKSYGMVVDLAVAYYKK